MLKSTYNIFTHFKVFKAWTAMVNSDFCVILRFQTASTFEYYICERAGVLKQVKEKGGSSGLPTMTKLLRSFSVFEKYT